MSNIVYFEGIIYQNEKSPLFSQFTDFFFSDMDIGFGKYV